MSSVTAYRLQSSTEEAWAYLHRACEDARASIAIEQYIFGAEGRIIEELSAVLMRKAREGVRVRLLLDLVGSFSFFRSGLDAKLAEAGVDIVFHTTVLPPSWNRLLPFILRDHRKLAVFDDREAHIGGVIIEERARDWRDTCVVVTGPIVEDAASLFDIAWEKARRMHPVGRMLSDGGKGEFYLAGNSFRLQHKILYRTIVRSITEAKRRICITTPYFSLTNDLRRALTYARNKGVAVDILLPKRSDNRLADFVTRLFYGQLRRRGIRIFEYSKSILHAKCITIDGEWATVGSCNLDWLSVWFNYELNLVSENPRFAAELEAQFDKDIAESDSIGMPPSA